MANVAYPDVLTQVKGHIPFKWDYNSLVMKTSFANGTESRRAVWQAPRKSVNIKYTHRTIDEAQVIYDFYQGREGSLREFVFFFPQVQSYVKEFCGTHKGDTGNQVTLPSKGAQAATSTLYVNGAARSFSFLSQTGIGEDRASVSGVLSAGDKIEFSFSGRLKIWARFSDDPVQVNEVKDVYSSFTVNLYGLQARLT